MSKEEEIIEVQTEKEKLSVYELLRARFPENEYALLSEVSDTTGFRNGSIDFMAINYWPSRGLAVHGLERKSNRGDWLKELKAPSKQESHFKHCDYFWLVTDKNDVAKIEEIPDNWGWLHLTGKRVQTKKPAPKLTPTAITKDFAIAMIRRAAEKKNYVHVSEIELRIEQVAEAKAKNNTYQLQILRDEVTRLEKIISDFEKHSGIKISHRWDSETHAQTLGRAINVLTNQNTFNLYINSIETIKKTVEKISNNAKNDFFAIKECGEIMGFKIYSSEEIPDQTIIMTNEKHESIIKIVET